MMKTFDHLKNSLSQSPGPKLAALYPLYPSREDRCEFESRVRLENIYLETSADLTHGSFGTFQTDNLLRELGVDWIERKQPWSEIEATLSDFRDATVGEPETNDSYDSCRLPHMAMQQVAAPVVVHRGLGWFESIFRCFL
jgi:hypothetical protein